MSTLHSHLGASGMERWAECFGSISLVQRFATREVDDADDPEYRWAGTVTHAAIADCLENGLDAWEVVGKEYDGHVLTADMSEGPAFYLSQVRPHLAKAEKFWIEQRLSEPGLHPALMGTVDLGMLMARVLRIMDYKNGVGVSVDVENNPQELYYAFLLLKRIERDEPATFAGIDHVELTIIQPNDFNPSGKVRTWLTTKDMVLEWGQNILIPAMHQADTETGLKVGTHCRFCPVKLVCPAQIGIFKALAEAKVEDAKAMDDLTLSRFYELLTPNAMMAKAIREEVYVRMMRGVDLSTAKLVKKQADRVWKPGALERFSRLFGTAAFTEPKLKSPAQMEALPLAKPLVQEFAYTPDTGLTVKGIHEKGMAIKPPKASSLLEAVKGS